MLPTALGFLKESVSRKNSTSSTEEVLSKASRRNEGSPSPRTLRGRAKMLVRRSTSTKSSQLRASTQKPDLGFRSRSGLAESTNLNDLDDETLEELLGVATHLSLSRKGSKGVMHRVPSCERFRGMSPVTPRSRRTSVSDSPRTITRTASIRRGSEVLKSASGMCAPAGEDWLAGAQVTVVDDDFDSKEDDSSDDPQQCKSASSGSRAESYSRLVRSNSTRRMTRRPSKERITIRERCTSIST